jgi:hypothetical protein
MAVNIGVAVVEVMVRMLVVMVVVEEIMVVALKVGVLKIVLEGEVDSAINVVEVITETRGNGGVMEGITSEVIAEFVVVELTPYDP